MTNANTEEPLFAPSVDALATLVEEGARANRRSTNRFIEPAQGTLRRAEIRRHHIVFGRRGSGKSSLLYKSAEVLNGKGFPTAYVDLEPFKGHHYPDVLLSVLLAAHIRFYRWLEGFETRRTFWAKLMPFSSSDSRHKRQISLLCYIKQTVRELEQQLHLTDGADLEMKREARSEAEISASVGLGGSQRALADMTVEAGLSRRLSNMQHRELSESYVRSKSDWLHRKILDFQKIFRLLHGT